MKSIYSISKGQLVTIWVFLGFIWLATLAIGLPDNWAHISRIGAILAWLIPFVLIFYTLGWRSNRKAKSE